MYIYIIIYIYVSFCICKYLVLRNLVFCWRWSLFTLELSWLVARFFKDNMPPDRCPKMVGKNPAFRPSKWWIHMDHFFCIESSLIFKRFEEKVRKSPQPFPPVFDLKNWLWIKSHIFERLTFPKWAMTWNDDRTLISESISGLHIRVRFLI